MVVQIHTQVGGDTQDGQKPRDTVVKGRMSTGSIKRQRDTQIVEDVYYGISFSLKKAGNSDTTRLNFENVMLSERHKTQKDKCYMIPLL